MVSRQPSTSSPKVDCEGGAVNKDDPLTAGRVNEPLAVVGVAELFQFADRLDKWLIAGQLWKTKITAPLL